MPSIKKNPVLSAAPESQATAPVQARSRRGHGRVTLQNVAAQAGVTSITVSRYLRHPGVVAPATALRIQTALSATGYLPNKQAGQLASGHSRMVAAIIPSISNSIFSETVQGLSDTLQASGYELMLASSGYSLEREEEQIRAVLAWSPSALVVTGTHHTTGALLLLNAAQRNGTPVIEVWDQPVEPQAASPDAISQVGFNHHAVGRAMAEHLLSRGHRRLAYVDSGVVEDFRAHERGAGFRAAAREHSRTHRRDPATVKLINPPAGDAFECGRLALAQILALPGTPFTANIATNITAAAFANDHLACGALLEAQARGIQVPAQIALMGFGDFPISRQLQPPLSTVSPPRHEIGVQAAEVLLAALQSGTPPAHRALEWQMQIRESTG
ncbi:MAG: LacI family DNA-binding transcriptional regulator [Pseudorhodobacter sp.]|nr:LacI family DNA-binding transcriptional regulator [Rhizobacter sp.]